VNRAGEKASNGGSGGANRKNMNKRRDGDKTERLGSSIALKAKGSSIEKSGEISAGAHRGQNEQAKAWRAGSSCAERKHKHISSSAKHVA